MAVAQVDMLPALTRSKGQGLRGWGRGASMAASDPTRRESKETPQPCHARREEGMEDWGRFEQRGWRRQRVSGGYELRGEKKAR